MAYLEIPPTYFPNFQMFPAGVYNLDIGSAGKLGIAFMQAPKTGDIESIKIGCATLTTGVVTLKASIQTWNSATNEVTGVLVNAGAEGTISVDGGTDDSTYLGPITFDTPASVTKGTVYCVVFTLTDWTSGVFRLASTTSTFSDWMSQYTPYAATVDGGSYSYQTRLYSLVLKYSEDSGYIPPPGYHAGIYALNKTFSTATSPSEYGMKFSYPINVRVTGMYVTADRDPVTYEIYDSLDNVLLSFDSQRYYASGTAFGGKVYNFPEYIDILAGEVYRFTVKPKNTTACTFQGPWYYEESMAKHSGICTGTARTGAGPWDDNPEHMVNMGLILDGVEASSGGASPFTYGFS